MALFSYGLSIVIKICSFHNWFQYLIILILLYNICANFCTGLHYWNQWVMKHNYFSYNSCYKSNIKSFSGSVLLFECLELFFEIDFFVAKELQSYVSLRYFCLFFTRCFVLLNTMFFRFQKQCFSVHCLCLKASMMRNLLYYKNTACVQG